MPPSKRLYAVVCTVLTFVLLLAVAATVAGRWMRPGRVESVAEPMPAAAPVADEPAVTARLQLAPRGVRGRVLAHDGRPVAGARVEVCRLNSPDSGSSESLMLMTTSSDGGFWAPGIAPGAYWLGVTTPDATSVLNRRLLVTGEHDVAVTLRARVPVTLSGVVRDAGSGLPLPGVDIRALGSVTARSDDRGAFAVPLSLREDLRGGTESGHASILPPRGWKINSLHLLRGRGPDDLHLEVALAEG